MTFLLVVVILNYIVLLIHNALMCRSIVNNKKTCFLLVSFFKRTSILEHYKEYILKDPSLDIDSRLTRERDIETIDMILKSIEKYR